MKKRIITSVKEIELNIILGFYPEERKKKQRVLINVSFEVAAAKKAIEKDNVKHTVNYAELTERIRKKVQASQFNLIETLGDFVLDIVMGYKQIRKAEIEILKPDAPLAHTKGSGLKIFAER